MSTCTAQIEKVKSGKFSVCGKTVYASEFTNKDAALRIASCGEKSWVVSHPSVKGFLIVTPVDANRIVRIGGSIVG